MPDKRSCIPWFACALLVVLLDQASKFVVLHNFTYGESHSITSFFNLVLVFNTGAAFSLLAGAESWRHVFFVLLASGVSIYLAVMIVRHYRERLLSCSLALILGGALGNLFDRLRIGAVVDFLDFHWRNWHWPAFNIADAAIFIGVILLLVSSFQKPQPA